jgi:hypothetical protein
MFALRFLRTTKPRSRLSGRKGSAKLRHVTRSHKVNLASTYNVFEDPFIDIEYFNTKEQVADIFKKALPPQSWEHILPARSPPEGYGGV